MKTDFVDQTVQGWEVLATDGAEVPEMRVIPGGEEPSSGFLLRIDDTIQKGQDTSYDLSYRLSEPLAQDLVVSFDVRFPAEGTGLSKYADVRLSVRDAVDLTYLRFRSAPDRLSGVSYHDREKSKHIESGLSELRPDDWYHVKIRIDHGTGTYSWEVDNKNSSDPQQHIKVDQIPLYHESKFVKRVSLVSLVRGGIVELDNFQIETVP